MKSLRTLALLALTLLAMVGGGCGSSSGSGGSSGAGSSGAASSSAGSGTSTDHVALAKTKFVLHSGLAFGAFHRYVYKPARAGDFAHPFSHKLTIIKAGLAVLFIKHELTVATHDAQADPLLSKLVAPITALQSRISGLKSDVSSGSVADITGANSQISSVESQANGSGAPIREQAPASL